MPAPFVTNIESSCISRAEPLHAFRKIRPSGFQKKMVMIPHERISVKIQIESLGCYTHKLDENVSVLVPIEYFPSFISPRKDVVQSAFIFYSPLPAHNCFLPISEVFVKNIL